MSDLRCDGFLGGRLQIWQPVRGYRAGADAVMLAAACPARAGETVLELGCGVGVASLCLGARVSGLPLTGVELQADYAELARRNAALNRAALRGGNMVVHCADLAALPADLRQAGFHHVIANPPYFATGTAAPDAGRAIARHELTALAAWIDVALTRLRPGGALSLIHRPERLETILAALGGRAGAVAVLPVAARPGGAAGRVIVGAIKGARAPLRLLAPFVMHTAAAHAGGAEGLTPAAQAVLREGAPITGLFTKHP